MCAIFDVNFSINYNNSLQHRCSDGYEDYNDDVNLFYNRLAISDLDKIDSYTEVFIYVYERCGVEYLNKFNRDFFCIYEKRQKNFFMQGI